MALVILIASLFYYIGRALFPNYVTGYILFSLLILTGSALLFFQLFRGKCLVLKNNIFLAGALLLSIWVLGSYAYSRQTVHQFETGLSNYFGVHAFFFFFFALFFYCRFEPAKAIRWAIVILCLEAMAEFFSINFLRNVDWLVHYDPAIWRGTRESFASGWLAGCGLLANRTKSANFILALWLLYQGFSDEKPSRLMTTVFVAGFLCVFSGTGFLMGLLALIILGKKSLLWLAPIFVIAMCLGSKEDSYIGKISPQYLAQMADEKITDMDLLMQEMKSPVSVLLRGDADLSGLSASNVTAVVQSVVEFGIWPVLFYTVLLLMAFNNFCWAGLVRRQLRPIKAAMVCLVVSTFHYPVLFAIPVQAFVAALAAYSMHLKMRDLHPQPLPA